MKWLLFLTLFSIGLYGNVITFNEVTKEDCPPLQLRDMVAFDESLKCYMRLIGIVTTDYYDLLIYYLKKHRDLSKQLHNQLLRRVDGCTEILNTPDIGCLPSDKKKLLTTIQKVYNEIAEYMLGYNSQSTIDMRKVNGTERKVNGTDFVQCYSNLDFIEGDSQCIGKEQFFKCFTTPEFYDPNVLSFEFTCRFFTELKTCIENLISEECQCAAPYIPDIVEIMKSGFCELENKPRNKIDVLLESSKYGLLSFVPSRKRVTRGIGDASSKLPHIEKRVKQLCGDEKELNESFETMKICLRAKPMFITQRDEYIAHIDSCSKETRKLLKQCLPEKLQYFPDFFFNLVESVVQLLYDDFGQIARGLSPCMPKLKEQASIDDYENCLARVGENFEDKILESKASFCEKFLKASGCFVKQLNDTCTTNSDLEKFKKDYMIAMERPCK